MYVPAIKAINLLTSVVLSDSPSNKKAKIATNPGVSASSGNALLTCRFFNALITQRKAATPMIDLTKRIERLKVLIVE